LCFILRLKVTETQKNIEIITASSGERLDGISPAVGQIAMPEGAKKGYIYIAKKSQQLVIESLAHEMDTYPVPVD